MGTSKNVIDYLHTKDLHPSPRPVRRQAECMPDLISSIKNVGLLNPLIVRRKGEDDDNGNNSHFEIISGHRRFEACKALGWPKVICNIVEVNDKEAYEISLIENLQQETINPIDEATAFLQYIHNFGWGGESELAQTIGKSQAYISRRIRLLDLPKEIQDNIMRRRINASLAQELFGIDTHEANTISKYALDNKLSNKEVREIARLVKRRKREEQLETSNNNNNTSKQYYENKNDNLVTLLHEKQQQQQQTIFGDDNDDNNYKLERSEQQQFSKRADLALKKLIVATRILLKDTDSVLEDFEEYCQKQEEEKRRKKKEDTNSKDLENFWILKEIIMQDRLALHNYLDMLLREHSKLHKISSIS